MVPNPRAFQTPLLPGVPCPLSPAAHLNTQHGQSVLSRAERQAEQEGSVPTYQLNTHIPKWVLDKPGVRDDWQRFERLFLTPHDFRAGEDYVLDAPGVGGLVGHHYGVHHV